MISEDEKAPASGANTGEDTGENKPRIRIPQGG